MTRFSRTLLGGAFAIAAGTALGGAAQDAGRSPPDALLVEAEEFAERAPDEHAFARVHDELWASGRAVLVGLSTGERVTWRVASPPPAAVELWIRYAARGPVELRWTTDEEPSDDERGWQVAALPATGALEGRGAWRWHRLGELPDDVGVCASLSIRSAPLRLDCLFFTPPLDGAPDWPVEPAPPRHDDALLAAIAASWDDTPLPWIARSVDIPLPGWYEAARSHLHTRLSAGWHDEPVFTLAAAGAARVGAGALVRHVKTMSGLCTWPTAIGAFAPWVEGSAADGTDPVEGMARRAHDAGVAFVAYYRHQEDRPLAREYPDWVCVDYLGRTIRTAGEPRLCYHSPFGEATLSRLRELVLRGADGVYLDESHQPLEGCWCEATRAAFERETGLPLPDAPLLEDPLYRRFLRFTEDSVAREIHRWREALRAIDSDFVVIVSSHRQPELHSLLPTARLAAGGDVVKTEFASGARDDLLAAGERLGADGRDRGALLALGWTLARDAAFGRPPHVWIHRLASAERWRAAAAAVAAHGGVANLDHREALLPEVELIGGAQALAGAVGRALAGARPVGRVAVHVPEHGRNACFPDAGRAWETTIGPFLRAWTELSKLHLAPRLVTDDQLAVPEAADPTGELEVLFLPAPGALTPSQRETVSRLRERGVVVVPGDLEDLVRRARSATPALVEAPTSVQVNRFSAPDGALIVTLSNDPSWADRRGPKAPAPVDGAVLRVEPRASSVIDVLTGERLDLDADGSVRLPTFQEVAVLRIDG